MVTEEQIEKANQTAADALEATKRIYDLAATAWEAISEDVAEQVGLKQLAGSWSSGDSRFLQRYGQLSESEKIVLKRYCYTAFAGAESSPLSEKVVPFVLFSIATRKLSQQPALIYGVLRNVAWGEAAEAEVEPFMYEISEKRRLGPLEVSSATVLSKKGSAIAQFDARALFEITDDTIGDISKEIIDWFNKKLR